MIPISADSPDVQPCDAVTRLLQVLTLIAAIPLWGEAIADGDLKAELLDAGEYDAGLDQFEPSADTESGYLRDAVELARAALAEVRRTSTHTPTPRTKETNT